MQVQPRGVTAHSLDQTPKGGLRVPKVKGPKWELEGLDSGTEKGAIYSGRVLMREGTFSAQRGRKSPGSRFLAVWCPGKVHKRAMGLPPHRKPADGARGEATLPVLLTCDSQDPCSQRVCSGRWDFWGPFVLIQAHACVSTGLWEQLGLADPRAADCCRQDCGRGRCAQGALPEGPAAHSGTYSILSKVQHLLPKVTRASVLSPNRRAHRRVFWPLLIVLSPVSFRFLGALYGKAVGLNAQLCH